MVLDIPRYDVNWQTCGVLRDAISMRRGASKDRAPRGRFPVMSTPVIPSRTTATPLRPATYAGVAAAVVSITAAIIIRIAPPATSVVTTVHLLLTVMLFVMGGALAARLGGDGWRAGVFAGLVDALVGHPIAFLISETPDVSQVTLPPGTEATPQLIASLHLWGAVLGAVVAVIIAAVAGAAGGWYARRTGVAPRASGGPTHA